jgi:hypothetical protein
MGSFSIFEAILVLAIMLLIAAVPIVLVVWAVRTLSRSRRRDTEILQRLDALEGRRRT